MSDTAPLREHRQQRVQKREKWGGPARITSKYQVTIPQDVREDLGADVGDMLLFVKDGAATWRIRRIPRDPVEALRLAGQGLPGTVAEVHREFEEGWQDEFRQ
jgi:AbrB family looped-hinge helix DNA binding protein